ncbi:MAG: hypothetical protein HYT37_00310 [Candidatus Sungbacteria bacterium]|nr:hypothetical protein [Candidatus Sungbacteria bacterium]
MDISKIKQFVKQNGDKFIMLDQTGEPDVVMLSFQEYDRLLQGAAGRMGEVKQPRAQFEEKPEVRSEPVLEETEFLPPQIAARARVMGRSSGAMPVRLEDIRLEDLPL